MIDLSKASDIADYSILLKKLEHYGIKNICLGFKVIHEIESKKEWAYQKTTREQRIIDLRQTSEFLKPVMFAEDKNLFSKSKTKNILFLNENTELQNISE